MTLGKKIFFSVFAIGMVLIFFSLYYSGKFGCHLSLQKTSFAQLQNWNSDDQSKALFAFQQSCVEILKRKPEATFSTFSQSKTNDWQSICQAAKKLTTPDANTARQFFETWFEPYLVQNNFNPHGFFTGYYLPVIHARLTQNKEYNIPIYALPNDLVRLNLGKFRTEFTGKTIVGQLKNNILLPYPDRASIASGAIQKNAKVIAWSNNLIDVFFAQIQGSALAELPNHQKMLIGYAGDNGRTYTAIGKVLLQKQALTRKNISMQSIRDWLEQHPEQVNDILNQDASYVFFHKINNKNPFGKEQVPLTAERSLAVDTKYIPLGAPIWLETTMPQYHSKNSFTPLQRLLIAQDTGGAIKGVVRGDVYWGTGDYAADIAGHMKNAGKYWILLPRK